MQPLCAFALLCTLPFLSPVLSLDCNDTQYPWPHNSPHLCCDKCPPGEYMAQGRHDNALCHIVCKPCTRGRFLEEHNTKMSCDFCEKCNKPNMKKMSNCSATQNAVCGCEAGYKCKSDDQSCKECVPIPSTTTTTPPPRSTTVKHGALTTSQTFQPMTDTVWFLVIIALLCAGIAIVVVTKIKPFLSWIKSKHGYFLAKEPAPSCSEDEEVCMPVQEGCGKCDV